MVSGFAVAQTRFFSMSRYYSPLLGRFINEDPLGIAGSGPNSYAYVFNSPTNLVDPFGLAAPALVPAVFGGLTLIQGGGGAAAISGTVVETGSVGGLLVLALQRLAQLFISEHPPPMRS